MRYYFDVLNGNGLQQDETGQDFPDRSSLEQEVIRILTDIAREELPTNEAGMIHVEVRDDRAQAIYSGSIALTKRWLVKR